MKIITIAVMFVLLAGIIKTAKAFDPQYNIHGSRASFLMIDNSWMTLHYLHPNAFKTQMMNAAIANGDTHFYIYSRNGGDNGGPFDLDYMAPQADWETQIQGILDKGLKPIMWLTPDDSPTITNQSIAAQKAHFDEMVRRFDKQISAYVVCLECDEYWGPAKVNELVRHLKTKTNKPVAVHLTSGVGGHKGNLDYYKGADYVFLQTGWDRSHEEITKMVQQAKAQTGLPVILSEYALESRSATARAMGDAGCAAGAVGTGNGRSITFCGQLPPQEKKKNRDTEYAITGVAIIALAGVAWYLYENYDFYWIWEVDDQSAMFGGSKDIYKTNNLNFNLEATSSFKNDFNSNRVLFSVNGTF